MCSLNNLETIPWLDPVGNGFTSTSMIIVVIVTAQNKYKSSTIVSWA